MLSGGFWTPNSSASLVDLLGSESDLISLLSMVTGGESMKWLQCLNLSVDTANNDIRSISDAEIVFF